MLRRVATVGCVAAAVIFFLPTLGASAETGSPMSGLQRQMKSGGTGQCLSVYSEDIRLPVVFSPCTSQSPDQRQVWYGNGDFTIHNRYNGYCLTADRSNGTSTIPVHLQVCDLANDYQKWAFITVPGSQQVVKFHNRGNDGWLDGNGLDGAYTHAREGNNPYQEWRQLGV